MTIRTEEVDDKACYDGMHKEVVGDKACYDDTYGGRRRYSLL